LVILYKSRFLGIVGDVNMMFGYWPMGWMMWIWVVIIGGLAYLGYEWFRPRRYRSYPVQRDPLEIAKQRLARGELTAEEYEEIRKMLAEH